MRGFIERCFVKENSRTEVERLPWYTPDMREMAGETESLKSLLNQGVQLVFTLNHTHIVQALLEQLSSPDALPFPDFSTAITVVVRSSQSLINSLTCLELWQSKSRLTVRCAQFVFSAVPRS